MLFLWDRGEGRVNPAMTASVKEEIPSFHCGHLSIRPRRLSPSTRLFTPGEFGDSEQHPIHSNPGVSPSAEKSPHFLRLRFGSFCNLYLRILCPFVLLLYTPIPFLVPPPPPPSSQKFSTPHSPPHHPPIVFQALS